MLMVEFPIGVFLVDVEGVWPASVNDADIGYLVGGLNVGDVYLKDEKAIDHNIGAHAGIIETGWMQCDGCVGVAGRP